MENKISINEQKRRKAIVFPLIALPFVTLLFWSLDGGKQDGEKLSAKETVGLKMELPGANNKKEGLDKMSYYAQAKSDSAKMAELMRNDPYYRQGNIPGANGSLSGYESNPLHGNSYGGLGSGYANQQESMIYQRINDINLSMDQKYSGMAQPFSPAREATGVNAADIDRLEQMMSSMQSDKTANSEVAEINDLLKSIQEIQHPEMVTEKLREASSKNRGQVFSVSNVPFPDRISVLSGTSGPTNNTGFYGLDNFAGEPQQTNAIRAVIHEKQILTDGSVVKLRLSSDVYINGVKIPSDNFIYGTANLRGERLEIDIDHIQYNGSLFPIKLSVFDLDGISGIHIPGAIARDVAKQSGTNAIQGVGLSSLDPSLAAQAATAGVELTKSLLSKKVKLVKVTVKAGYQVLLKDENQKK